MPINSFEHLQKGMTNKDRWIEHTEINEKDINKLLQEYSETYNKPSLQIKLDVHGNIINAKTNKRFSVEEMLALKTQLDYIGVFENIEYEGLESIKINEIDTPVYIRNIRLMPDKQLVQTTAYVLAIRTPVQDYNATPVLKITGLVHHTAMECHAALYGNIGGDNDGDTAAFLPVRHAEVKDGILTNLKADDTGIQLRKNDTAEMIKYHDGNYDKGYLDGVRKNLNYGITSEEEQEIIKNLSLDKKLEIIKDEEDATRHYNTSDMTRAFIGKKAAPNTKIKLTLNKGTFETEILDDAYNVRTGDTQYTLVELISNTGDIGKSKLNNIKESIANKNIKIPKDVLSTGIYNNEMFWVSVHIWMNNDGQELSNEDFYKDAKAIKEYAENHEAEITMLKKLEYYLREHKEGKALVKGFKDEMRKHAEYNTLTRGHVSKAGISKTGTMRKNIYLSTELSIYSNMNKDKTGKVWNKAYGVNAESFTMNQLIQKVYGESNTNKLINDLSIEDLYKIKNSWEDTKTYINWKFLKTLNPNVNAKAKTKNGISDLEKLYVNSYDLKLIASTMLERIIEYKIAQQVIYPLMDFARIVFDSKHADTSWTNLYKILSNDQLLPEMEILKEHIESNNLQNDKTAVPEPIQEYVLSYYFSRFRNDLGKINKEINAHNETAKQKGESITSIEQYYLDAMLNQIMLTRSTSKKLNEMIQMPISESKHGSILKNGTDTYKWFNDRAEVITNSLVSNRFMVGNFYKHKRWVALGGDYNYIGNHNIKYQESEAIKNIRKENATESNEKQNPDVHGTDEFRVAANNILKIDVCGGFLSNNNFIKFLTHFKEFTEILHNSAASNNGKFDPVLFFSNAVPEHIDKVINAVKTFERFNIPFYKLAIGTMRIQEKYLQFRNPRIVNDYYAQEIIRFYLADKYKMQVQYKKELQENPNFVYFFNYIIDKDNPVSALDKQVSTDIIDSKLENSQIKKGNKFMSNIELLEQMTGEQVLKKTEEQKLYNELLDNLLQEVDLESINEKGTIEDFIKECIKSIKQAEIIKDRNLKLLDTAKNNNTLESAISKVIYKTIGPSSYYKDTTELSRIRNELMHNKQFIDELNKLINKNERDIKKVQTELDELDIYIKVLKEENPNKDNSSLKETLLSEIKSLKEKKKKEFMKIIQHIIVNNSDLVNYIINTGGSGYDNIKPISNDDIRNFESQLIMRLDNYQRPFTILISMFTIEKEIKVKGSKGKKIKKEIIDWDGMYEYLKKNHRFIRITQVEPARDVEGLARKFIDYVTVIDQNKYEYDGKYYEYDKLPTKKAKKKYLEAHKKATVFESFEDLIKQTNIVFSLGKLDATGKLYKGAASDVTASHFITPTLKQIEITSPKVLENIWKDLSEGNIDERYPIGFTYLNEIISATEDAYKPFKTTGFGARVLNRLINTQKFLMRYSQGFLLRNYIDTLIQTATDMYNKEGLTPIIYNPQQLIKYIKYGEDIYNVYHLINEERMFTLLDVMNTYNTIKNTSDTARQLDEMNHLADYIQRYIDHAEAMENPNDRIKYRLNIAKDILKQFNEQSNKVLFNTPYVIDKMYKFLMNIRFAEYYYFYDNIEINGKPILGLRVDADKKESRKTSKKLKTIINKQDSTFESLLIEVSALERTNAMSDMFKEQQYKELYKLSAQMKDYMLKDTSDEHLDIIEKEIQESKKESSKALDVLQTLSGYKLFSHLTERTERMARIFGFILNRQMYDKTFDDSVNISLKSWFNYGQRTPLESQLMYDIPYVSFPIRSIMNWTDRLLNPRYAVLIDDIIDGVYGQYEDEDGQHDEWTKFMINNGWVPITDKWGIRMGSGVLDTMNLLYNTGEQIEQRRSPVLRGLQKFIESGDLQQAAKQLSTVGVLNRFAQSVTLGAYNANKGTMSKPTVGRATTAFFTYNEYEKYTPYKYRNNNGRYVWYENVYKNWFNKYGRMRKPTTDPVQMVKNIQWQQFVKRMQHKYRR